jgi:FkbM family methyltransferase
MSRLNAFNIIRSVPPAYNAVMSMHDVYSWLKSKKRGTYSQHSEDLFVSNFFAGKKKGSYLDIGASHPFKLSNTYLLYRLGWNGVTVEPIPRLGRLHRKWRPRDTLFPVAVGVERGELEFFEMTPSVLSTLDRAVAEQYIADGNAILFKKYNIEIVPINEIVERVSAIAPIDFLSIDIEGLDAEVLSAIDYSRFRPALICVEANSDDAQRKTEDLFKHAGYKIINTIKCNLMASPA